MCQEKLSVVIQTQAGRPRNLLARMRGTGRGRGDARGPAHHWTLIVSTSTVMPLTCGVEVAVVTLPAPALTPLIFIE